MPPIAAASRDPRRLPEGVRLARRRRLERDGDRLAELGQRVDRDDVAMPVAGFRLKSGVNGFEKMRPPMSGTSAEPTTAARDARR
jgi:hypothetical protein